MYPETITRTVPDYRHETPMREKNEVHAWLVKLEIGSDVSNYHEHKEAVFLTDGVDLGQLQREVELRYNTAGRRAMITEIKALGAIGNSKI